MSQEDQLNEERTPEQDAAEFMAGFNAVTDPDAAASESKAPEAVVEKVEANEPEVKEESAEAEESDPVVFAGMSESQIKSLLERSAKVDAIEEQLRKAHGKIGELNSHVQQLSSQRQQPAPQAYSAPAMSDEEMSQWEQDFPELAAIVEAKLRKMQPAAPQIESETVAQTAPQQVVEQVDPVVAANLAVMDSLHDGWRNTINSQDFNLWIATQPQDVQTTFNTSPLAKDLSKIISDFDAWKTKASKSKSRLESAVLPSGNTTRVVTAPSAADDFMAGFNSVRSRYA